MANDRVDHSGENGRNHEVAGEPHALGHRPRDDGRRRAAEPQLKNEERHQPGIGGLSEEKAGGAEYPTVGGAEHQRKPEDPEDGGRKTEVGEVLGRHVDAVLATYEAAFKTGETRLHQHDQGCTHEYPRNIKKLLCSRHQQWLLSESFEVYSRWKTGHSDRFCR